MFTECSWINEPARWSLAGDILSVTTDGQTDFWRETYYGFTRHSGHLFGRPVEGDFTAELRIWADYTDLYDQAGLMIWLDEKTWLKAGIEYSDGQASLSSVLTVERSDWATAPYPGDPRDFRIRATVAKGALKLQASADGKTWSLQRLCPFPHAQSYCVGPVCCTPERAGLNVSFSEFRVGPAIAKPLHDLA